MVFTSSLKRTKETVEDFINDGRLTKAYPEIDEIGWGKYEGVKTSPYERHDYKEMMRDWANGILTTKIEGGENPLELQARIQVFIGEMLKTDHQTILIATHGRTMRCMLCTMLGQGLENMQDYPHGNLSLYKLFHDGEGFNLDWHNVRSHLKHLE